MKTPRQILFERHRRAEAKLDAIRQAALASLAAGESPRKNTSPGILVSLRAAFLSFRWHLAGMSAVWVAVALLNMDTSPAPVQTVAKRNAPSPRQLLAALRESRRQLLELIDPPASEPFSPAPPSFVPPRRSEGQSPNSMA